jgi:hypothetical protein
MLMTSVMLSAQAYTLQSAEQFYRGSRSTLSAKLIVPETYPSHYVRRVGAGCRLLKSDVVFVKLFHQLLLVKQSR